MSTDHADVRNRAITKALPTSPGLAPLPLVRGEMRSTRTYVARRKDLKALGLQAMESEGKLVFTAVLAPVIVYSKDALVWPRGTNDTLASDPRPVGDLTRLYTVESYMIGSSCCATKKRRQGAAAMRYFRLWCSLPNLLDRRPQGWKSWQGHAHVRAARVPAASSAARCTIQAGPEFPASAEGRII
jgi:hypothetical protein